MHRPTRRAPLRLLAASALALLAGCGESRPTSDVPTYPVRGKVVLGDGKPLTSGVVRFVADGEPAKHVAGTLTADGSFSVMTDSLFAGAPAGDYKVRIEPDPDAPSAPAKGKAGTLLAKYRKESASGLTATVKPEADNELPPFVIR